MDRDEMRRWAVELVLCHRSGARTIEEVLQEAQALYVFALTGPSAAPVSLIPLGSLA